MRKELEESSDFEEFRKYYGEQYGETLGKEDEEYLKTHLKGMDGVKKAWYLHSMKTWTKENYNNYTRFNIEMLGGERTEEEWLEIRVEIQKILRNRKRNKKK